MKTRIVKFGNSMGIRIPKPLIEQTGLEGEVEIEVRRNSLVISAAHKPRTGWDGRFREMAKHGDDSLLDADVAPGSAWDGAEWEWQ